MGHEGDGVGKGGVSFRNLRTFTSLGNPVFRIFFFATLCSTVPMNMQMLARSLLVYRMTGSPAILGSISLAHAIPALSLSLFGGVIADRVQKKYVLLLGQGMSALISLGVALALTLGYLGEHRPDSWWILIIASICQGTAMGLMMPSRQAIVAEIVGEEDLMNALALNNMGMNVLRLIAPAMAGFLVDLIGFKAVYYTMAASYGLAVLLLAFMPLTGTMTIRGQGILSEVRAGFQYIKKETTIFVLLVISLFMVLCSMPYMQLMPVFTEDVLKVGASGMGVLISVSGIGAMAGSLFLASLPNRKRGLMFLISGFILGLALASFSFSETWHLSLVIIIFVGLGQAGRMTLANTLLQYYVDDDYRGRVMSIMLMQFGLTSFATFFTGIMAENIGIQWSIGSLGIILMMIALASFLFVPRIRKLE